MALAEIERRIAVCSTVIDVFRMPHVCASQTRTLGSLFAFTGLMLLHLHQPTHETKRDTLHEQRCTTATQQCEVMHLLFLSAIFPLKPLFVLFRYGYTSRRAFRLGCTCVPTFSDTL